MKLPLRLRYYRVLSVPHSSDILDADGESIASGCIEDANGESLTYESGQFDPDDALDIVIAMNEREKMMRVVLAAWDVIEHRTEEYLDNTIWPYAGLKEALVELAKGVKV